MRAAYSEKVPLTLEPLFLGLKRSGGIYFAPETKGLQLWVSYLALSPWAFVAPLIMDIW